MEAHSYTPENTQPSIPCLVCGTSLELRLAKGRKSGKPIYAEPANPTGIQEIDVPVLGMLGDQLHLNSMICEVLHAVTAVSMA